MVTYVRHRLLEISTFDFTKLANNSSLPADASSSIFTGSTVPKWLSQAANRGRNVVVLRDSTRSDDHGEEGENGDGIAIPPGMLVGHDFHCDKE